jgi:hypothetical protein
MLCTRSYAGRPILSHRVACNRTLALRTGEMEGGIEVVGAATVQGKTDRATQRKTARRGSTFCESSCCVATRVTPPEPVSPAA